MVELIGSTTTSTGLKVHAEHDTGSYPKGIEVSDAGLAAVPLKPHKFHGEWNYTISRSDTLQTINYFSSERLPHIHRAINNVKTALDRYATQQGLAA